MVRAWAKAVLSGGLVSLATLSLLVRITTIVDAKCTFVSSAS